MIVVDDGSENPPEAIVQSFRHALPVRLVRVSHAGPAAARNAGAAVARGRYLAFTDDDCRPTTGWLQALGSHLDEDPGSLVGGRTVNSVERNPYAAASQCLIDHLFSYYNADPSDARLLTSNNLALARDLFHSSGGFDERFPVAAAEDRELCDRLRRAGGRLVYAADAVVRHHSHLTLGRFWRQHWSYGAGAYRFHRLRGESTGERIRVEPFSYYWRLLRGPTAGTRAATFRLRSLVALSQVANTLGFTVGWWNDRRAERPWRPR